MKSNLLSIHRVVRLSSTMFLLALCTAALLIGCGSTNPQIPSGQLDNPASENCIKQGGTLNIQKNGKGDEYGVCTFEDNRQCEEWAMLRGECPVGGVKITGYVTVPAQYCAITGGEYKVTGGSNTDQEQGICTFKNTKTCDVWDYYNGKCSPNQ